MPWGEIERAEIMGAIGTVRDLRFVVEFRAACLWERFWLAGDAAERRAVSTVLATVPQWPSVRENNRAAQARRLAAAAAAGNESVLEADVAVNCVSAP